MSWKVIAIVEVSLFGVGQALELLSYETNKYLLPLKEQCRIFWLSQWGWEKLSRLTWRLLLVANCKHLKFLNKCQINGAKKLIGSMTIRLIKTCVKNSTISENSAVCENSSDWKNSTICKLQNKLISANKIVFSLKNSIFLWIVLFLQTQQNIGHSRRDSTFY